VGDSVEDNVGRTEMVGIVDGVIVGSSEGLRDGMITG